MSLFRPPLGHRSHYTRTYAMLATTFFGLAVFAGSFFGVDMTQPLTFLTGPWAVVIGIAVGTTEATNAAEALRRKDKPDAS